MTIRFVGHVQKQEHDSAGHVRLTIIGETPVCQQDIVVLVRREDAPMYTPGKPIQVQIHPL